ncbi:phosphoribosyl transferase domain-containing protein [Aphelenchoides avenae]|nr:phosphoribosyl transferase domain-containing protein [Aphelenchus avenae]
MTAYIQYKGVTVPDDQEYGTSMFMVPGCYNGDLKAVIIPEGAIRDRIRRLAHEVHEAIGDQVCFCSRIYLKLIKTI